MPKINIVHVYRLLKYIQQHPHLKPLHSTITKSLKQGTKPRQLFRAIKDLVPPHIMEKVFRGIR